MIALSLPPIEAKIETDGSVKRIYDRLRRRYVALTPEEWVRQHFVDYLITVKGYRESLMANEVGLKLNDTLRRCDTVVFDGKGNPAVIVEYKAPTVAITQKVFDQIVRYNMVLRASVLIVSNGLSHYCCWVDYKNRQVVFLADIPDYEMLLSLVAQSDG